MGLPHSEIRGSQLGYQLLSAYRRFQRPSSPLNAKASIMCPFRLGHANLTPWYRMGPSEPEHATLDLHESSDRARDIQHSRADSSCVLEFVLGVCV